MILRRIEPVFYQQWLMQSQSTFVSGTFSVIQGPQKKA
ncbi:hypothetical protein OU5_0169 [Pseudomonas mandelii JR-1]|uniref:Uncharacterized protein n=1 Tax=Pseudomonas mandelii JR-1 TaxID=1147786 RepID=A0A024E4M3_9PSED|nr:hypothetical protein OU5_0169 [Pseudomonas mandelii JR-1]